MCSFNLRDDRFMWHTLSFFHLFSFSRLIPFPRLSFLLLHPVLIHFFVRQSAASSLAL